MRTASAAAMRPGPSTVPQVDFNGLALPVYPSPATNVALYRLPQVLARIPVSRSAWFAGVRSGRYPHGFSLGPRTTVWRSDDIDAIIQGLLGERDRHV